MRQQQHQQAAAGGRQPGCTRSAMPPLTLTAAPSTHLICGAGDAGQRLSGRMQHGVLQLQDASTHQHLPVDLYQGASMPLHR